MSVVNQKISKIRDLCQKYNVLTLYVFGSVNTQKFNKDSDIDFLVEFKDVELQHYADNYFDFKFSLEKLFKRNVDLLEKKAIKNPFLKKNISLSKQLIYG